MGVMVVEVVVGDAGVVWYGLLCLFCIFVVVRRTDKGRNARFSRWGRLWCVQCKGSRVGLVSREVDC